MTGSLDEGWDETGELRPIDRLETKGPNQHDQATRRELEKMVQQALAQVSPELREAVILRDLQDLDYKEIAVVLSIPEGTVKSRISRGRAELARLLERNKREGDVTMASKITDRDRPNLPHSPRVRAVGDVAGRRHGRAIAARG